MPSFGTLLPDDEFFFNLETADSVAAALNQEEMTAYPTSPIFTFGPEQIGYVQAGKRTLVLTKGQHALLIWIDKALRTPRGSYAIYGNDYGTDFAAKLGSASFAQLQVGLEDDLRRCLTIHPLVQEVKDVTLEQLSGESTIMYLTIHDKLAGETRLTVAL